MKHIKKLIALAMVAATILAVAVPAVAVTTGKYNTTAVFLRPSVDSSNYLGRVNKGTTCDIIDSATGSGGRLWYKVTITSNTTNDGVNLKGKTGWSWAEFIDVTGGGTPNPRPQTMEEAFGTSNLKMGSSGNKVKNVQYCMYFGGYGDPDFWWSDVDGAFGPRTKQAVMNFQTRHFYELGGYDDNDVVDGIVGPKTKALLWQKYSSILRESGWK